jgi:hypothetical protein
VTQKQGANNMDNDEFRDLMDDDEDEMDYFDDDFN